ncbi:hypothetical protein [Methylocystis sp.]|uniref:hypothetical protein n=1 Tax=Methylocystis sp. TaxID=1911079 RepID=UPI003DA2696F
MTDAPALLQRRFQIAEHMRAIYFVTVEESIKPEDVLRPDFWLHVASQLKPYDLIEVAVDSCEWRMELVVCDVWHCGARVAELNRIDMAGKEEEDQSVGADLRVKWRGPVNKWCVVRADGVILRGGLDNKNTALETLTAIAQERQ